MYPTTLIDVIHRHATSTPADIAYSFLRDGELVEEQLSYAELDVQARAIAATLRQLVAPGGRAMLFFETGLSFVTAFLGCRYAGVVAVLTAAPGAAHLEATISRMSAIAVDARPAVVLTTAALLPALERAACPRLARARWQATDRIHPARAALWSRPRVDGSSLAYLQYTGATSRPTCVRVSHDELLASLETLRAATGLQGRYNLVGWLPPLHDAGLIGAMLHGLYVGGETRLMALSSFLEQPVRWLRAIAGQRRVVAGGPSVAFELCRAKASEADTRGLDLSEWRVAFCGAGRLRAGALERFYEAFKRCGLRREALLPWYDVKEATHAVHARAPAPASASLESASLERGVVQDPCERDVGPVSCGLGRGAHERVTLAVHARALVCESASLEPAALEHGVVQDPRERDASSVSRSAHERGSLVVHARAPVRPAMAIVAPAIRERLLDRRVGERGLGGESVAGGHRGEVEPTVATLAVSPGEDGVCTGSGARTQRCSADSLRSWLTTTRPAHLTPATGPGSPRGHRRRARAHRRRAPSSSTSRSWPGPASRPQRRRRR